MSLPLKIRWYEKGTKKVRIRTKFVPPFLGTNLVRIRYEFVPRKVKLFGTNLVRIYWVRIWYEFGTNLVQIKRYKLGTNEKGTN